MGERLPCKQEAIGSNPFISTAMGSELRWLERAPDKREGGGARPLEPTRVYLENCIKRKRSNSRKKKRTTLKARER